MQTVNVRRDLHCPVDEIIAVCRNLRRIETGVLDHLGVGPEYPAVVVEGDRHGCAVDRNLIKQHIVELIFAEVGYFIEIVHGLHQTLGRHLLHFGRVEDDEIRRVARCH